MLDESGIFEIGGPTWDETKAIIYDQLSEDKAKIMVEEHGWGSLVKWYSYKMKLHASQNFWDESFQRYIPDYWRGNRQAEKYNMSHVRETPMGFFNSEFDRICNDKWNLPFAAQMGKEMMKVNKYYASGKSTAKAAYNGRELVADLLDFFETDYTQ